MQRPSSTCFWRCTAWTSRCSVVACISLGPKDTQMGHTSKQPHAMWVETAQISISCQKVTLQKLHWCNSKVEVCYQQLTSSPDQGLDTNLLRCWIGPNIGTTAQQQSQANTLVTQNSSRHAQQNVSAFVVQQQVTGNLSDVAEDNACVPAGSWRCAPEAYSSCSSGDTTPVCPQAMLSKLPSVSCA